MPKKKPATAKTRPRKWRVEKFSPEQDAARDEGPRLIPLRAAEDTSLMERHTRLADRLLGPSETRAEEEPESEIKLRETYRAGERVPSDGPFWVRHYQHRLPHLCRIALLYFPPCGECDDKVRFMPAPDQSFGSATAISDDRDFKDAAGIIPARHR